MRTELDNLVTYRNRLNDKIYDILEKHGDNYTTEVKYKLNKIYREIDKLNRRITKIEKMENEGIQVYEPTTDFI